jgi:predicted nuclease of predicted toxin-antitoxin system
MVQAAAAESNPEPSGELMRLLIDECLHTSLVAIAHQAGHACDHVNFIGLSGHKDWQLMDRIRAGEYAFVTNNRVDFAALYDREKIHAGLIIIVPNATPRLQPELFRAALAHIGRRELVNALLEVDITHAGITCREFLYPERK